MVNHFELMKKILFPFFSHKYLFKEKFHIYPLVAASLYIFILYLCVFPGIYCLNKSLPRHGIIVPSTVITAPGIYTDENLAFSKSKSAFNLSRLSWFEWYLWLYEKCQNLRNNSNLSLAIALRMIADPYSWLLLQ